VNAAARRRLVDLSTRFNPVASALLRTPLLHWVLSPALMLITVEGRKTGRRYTIPVAYHEHEDAIVILVAEAASKRWWRNYRRPGPIALRLRGMSLEGTAEVVPSSSVEFRRRAEACFRRSRLIGSIFGVDFDPNIGLSEAQLAALAAQAAIVRVTVAATTGRTPG
jgi:hypothetical protein